MLLVFVLTHFVAFFVALLFEYPLTEILKLLMMQNKSLYKDIHIYIKKIYDFIILKYICKLFRYEKTVPSDRN